MTSLTLTCQSTLIAFWRGDCQVILHPREFFSGCPCKVPASWFTSQATCRVNTVNTSAFSVTFCRFWMLSGVGIKRKCSRWRRKLNFSAWSNVRSRGRCKAFNNIQLRPWSKRSKRSKHNTGQVMQVNCCKLNNFGWVGFEHHAGIMKDMVIQILVWIVCVPLERDTAAGYRWWGFFASSHQIVVRCCHLPGKKLSIDWIVTAVPFELWKRDQRQVWFWSL